MYSASFLIVVHLCVAMAITGKVYAFFLKPITYIGNFFQLMNGQIAIVYMEFYYHQLQHHKYKKLLQNKGSVLLTSVLVKTLSTTFHALESDKYWLIFNFLSLFDNCVIIYILFLGTSWGKLRQLSRYKRVKNTKYLTLFITVYLAVINLILVWELCQVLLFIKL